MPDTLSSPSYISSSSKAGLNSWKKQKNAKILHDASLILFVPVAAELTYVPADDKYLIFKKKKNNRLI